MATRIVTGNTEPENTDWKPVETGGQGIWVEVDTSEAGFSETPRYFSCLAGRNALWIAVGGSSIYLPTNKRFRVYLQRFDGRELTPQFANDARFQWHINWMAVEA